MARLIQQPDTPQRLQIREGGGGLALFGLPFLAAGIFVILMSLGVVPVTNTATGSAWFLLPLMGLVFSLVGGTLVFGRRWTTIDAAERVVTKEWGLLVPMRIRTHVLHDYTAVTLGFVEGDSDTADRFPVGLKSGAGPSLDLCSSSQYAESRACAVAVAQLLQLDIEDISTDHPTRLTANQADTPLAARLQLEHGEENLQIAKPKLEAP